MTNIAKKIFRKTALMSMLMVGTMSFGTSVHSSESENMALYGHGELFCPANSQWVQNPNNPPDEIPLGKKANICQFYQFSWQWFISLMNKPFGNERVFQNINQYPIFLGTSKDSCTDNNVASKLFVRTQKDDMVTADDFITPSDMNQALSGAVIYDQNRNVVLYQTHFDKGMCGVPQDSKTLPAGTTELKTSWRKINESEKNDYVWISSDTNENGTLESTEIYGLVGFHLVKSTELHPEFIWATFEHRKNAPDCQAAPIAGQLDQWSFTSESCAAKLPSPGEEPCNFNKTCDASNEGVTCGNVGKATEICQVYAQGTNPGDNQSDVNRGNIITINMQLNSMFEVLSTDNSLSVLKNYELVGGIWENDVSLPSSDTSNLRGSIQLANTTMETNAQQGFGEIIYSSPDNLQPAAHCFNCHQYTGRDTNAGVSHIFSKIHGTND